MKYGVIKRSQENFPVIKPESFFLALHKIRLLPVFWDPHLRTGHVGCSLVASETHCMTPELPIACLTASSHQRPFWKPLAWSTPLTQLPLAFIEVYTLPMRHGVSVPHPIYSSEQGSEGISVNDMSFSLMWKLNLTATNHLPSISS